MDKRLQSLRKRCREDLIFLASRVLGYDRITYESHGNVARLFIEKREGVPYLQQSDVKERLLMMPRGTFKSTLDVADAVQAILIDPNIRILVLTGASALADAFVSEIVAHFVKRDNATPLSLIFPEYCIKESEARTGSFTVPNRTKIYKEPTVMSAGIESATSGYHFDELRCDDVCTNRNSESQTYLERTARSIHMATKMLNPGGYLYLIGTHYNPSDAYALAIDAACEDAEVKRKDVDEQLLTDPEPIVVGGLKILRKPAWIHNRRRSNLSLEDLKRPEDFTLVFPEILSFKFLAKQYRKDQQSFFTQYLNDPYVAGGGLVTPDLLRECTIPADQIPKEGKIFCAWDLSYKNGKTNDYTAAVVGILNNGIMYAFDSVYAKYRPSEIGKGIAAAIYRWKANQVDIEDCLGAQWLESSIRNELVGSTAVITWIPVDRSENSKQVRIKSIESMLASGRLYLSANMSNLTVLYDQLLRAGVSRKDDLADTLAYLSDRIPIDRLSLPEAVVNYAEEARKKALYRLVYGYGEPTPVKKEPEIYSPQSADGLDELCPGLGF